MTTPIVIISPAMAVGSRFYRPVAATFIAQGWHATISPRRGFEPGTPPASRQVDWSYADEIADLQTAIDAVRERHPGQPVILLGHSLGGQFATAIQAGDRPADAVVTIGTALPHFRFYGVRSPGLVLMAAAVHPATALRGFVPAPMFGGPGARTLMREWAQMILTGRLPFPIPEKVTTPTLSIQLEGDTMSIPAATRHFERVLFNRESLTRWDYRQSETPVGGSTDHIHWVRTPDTVVNQIIAWWATVSVTA